MEERHSESPTDKTADVSVDKLTLVEAARRLGVTKDAVRKRVNRNSLAHERAVDGTIYVYLDASTDTADMSADEGTDISADALLEAYRRENELLRDTLAAERRANEENRRIIAGLVQRIPELEAPPRSVEEAENVAESASEAYERVEEESAAEPESGTQRSWWRRLFGSR